MRIPLGAFLLLSLALILIAGAQAQSGTIVVTSRTTLVKAHDTTPKGKPNKGDFITFRDLLLNRADQFGKKKGKAVAYDVGTMTYTSATETKIYCKATFPGIGTVTFAGPFVTQKDGTTVIPITGGTGAFEGIMGTVTVGAGATSASNTYVFKVPHGFDIHATGVA